MSKVSKGEADYRDHPRGTDHCAICVMFRKPSSCTKVDGKIAEHGWCRFYYSKNEQ